MTLVINKNQSVKEIKLMLEKKLVKTDKTGNLAKHFGKLKRNLDGLKYQNETRKNED
jgi:hypothetical protein